MLPSEVFFSFLAMRNRSLFSLFLCFVVFAGAIIASKSWGIARESWGTALFSTQRHDFGSVALGADAEFRFELTNSHNQAIQLQSVRSSCNCVSARLSTTVLRPGETGAVIAKLNTTGQHLRNKSAVLTVQLTLPTDNSPGGVRRVDTVQLFVSGFIRPDVMLTPGSIEFGAVGKGTTAERTLLLEYTGRPGWALTRVERTLPFIYARAEEIRRDRGSVAYRITAVLRDDAPAGYIRDALRFTTNEMQPGRPVPIEIVLPIQGVVTAAMQVKPSPLSMGILAPGESVMKNIVIRSEVPFRITRIVSSDARFRFSFSERSGSVQMVSVMYSAGSRFQDVADEIRISTDDPRQREIAVQVFARVCERSLPPPDKPTR